MTHTTHSDARTVPDLDFLSATLACPNCGASLAVQELEDLTCSACGSRFPKLPFGWDLRPAQPEGRAEIWAVWDQLQANGVASYENDPQRNLGVGPRPDSRAFGQFCRLHGAVLDVGCGPQPWPSHFEGVAAGTTLIGIDPLVGDRLSRYTQLRALAEHAPFRAGVFDHVVFATSFDHFIDPAVALREAKRLCHPHGEIDIWLGEKKPGAPRLAVSPEWYTRLVKPQEAEDQFHLKRPSVDELKRLGEQVSLVTVDEEFHVVDDYRRNYFCRMRHA